jgi:hypothetical protein
LRGCGGTFLKKFPHILFTPYFGKYPSIKLIKKHKMPNKIPKTEKYISKRA